MTGYTANQANNKIQAKATEKHDSGRPGDGNYSNKIFKNILNSRLNAVAFSDGFGIRHLFALLAFIGYANIYSLRVNLSVAIVAMVKSGK